jgi:hypothetical protein
MLMGIPAFSLDKTEGGQKNTGKYRRVDWLAIRTQVNFFMGHKFFLSIETLAKRSW